MFVTEGKIKRLERRKKMSARKNITRKDVAQKAGVSVSVVSRALNNSGYVEKEKKAKIIKVAEQLGYRPNPVAMALQTRKTYQIIFFCNDLTGAYYNQMYHGMAKSAEQRGYHLLLQKDFDFTSVKNRLTDGLIFPTESAAKEYADLIGKNYYLPAVTASFDLSVTYAKPMPSVVIDNRVIVNKTIDYLKEKGHKKIGMLLPFDYGYADLRFQAWKERMSMEFCLAGEDEEYYKHYLFFSKSLIEPGIHRIDRSLEDYKTEIEGFVYYDLHDAGYQSAEMIMEAKYRPSVVICFNDDMALGLMTGLRELGVSVPDEISIMGIDGIFTRNHFRPILTTMALYPERQGAKCADILIDMLEGKKYKYMNDSPYGILEGETVKDFKKK